MENQETKLEKLVTQYGPIKELVGPSKKKFYIREQNGADDDLLSSSSLMKENNNLNMFIVSIVVMTDAFDEGVLNLKNIGRLAIKDKYFILFASRIFSIGNDIKFKYNWGKDKGGVHDYEDDLSSYLWDYSDLENNPLPDEGDEGYNRFMMQPYSNDPYNKMLHTTTSGKEFRFSMMNVQAELTLMKRGDDISRNDDLLARNLEQKVDSNWIAVKNFSFLSKRDTIELHTVVEELEKPFFGFTELENPIDGGSVIYPLISDPAFFFPLAI